MKAQELLQKSKKMNSKKLEKMAFDECKYHNNDTQGFGYGEAETWEFADGSMLIYDGRGYSAKI